MPRRIKNVVWGGIGFLFLAGSTGLNVFYQKNIFQLSKDLAVSTSVSDTLRVLNRAAFLESNLVGRDFPDLEFRNINGLVFRKDSFQQEKYSLVFLTSFSSCSPCRDAEIELWKEYVDEIKTKTRIVGIAVDEVATDQQLIQIERYVRASRLDIPWFFDVDQSLLEYLRFEQEQTPLTVLVDGNGVILVAHQAVVFRPEKTKRFQSAISRILQRS